MPYLIDTCHISCDDRNSVLGIGSFKLGHVLRHVPLCVGIGFVIIQKNMYWICNSACGLLPRRAATAIGYVSKFEGIYFKKVRGPFFFFFFWY